MQWHVEVSPTLTTHNKYLWLLIAGEIGLPLGSKTLYRLMTPPERFALQGKTPELAPLLGSATLATKAAGNAFPTQLVAAVLNPMLCQIVSSGQALTDLPTESYNSHGVDADAAAAQLLQKLRKTRPSKRKAQPKAVGKRIKRKLKRTTSWGSFG